MCLTSMLEAFMPFAVYFIKLDRHAQLTRCFCAVAELFVERVYCVCLSFCSVLSCSSYRIDFTVMLRTCSCTVNNGGMSVTVNGRNAELLGPHSTALQ